MGNKPPKNRNLPKPTLVDPDADEREEQLAKEANATFEVEENTVSGIPSTQNSMPGVPMDEELDPDKVEEYCEREPWILTDLKRAPYGAKYGVITARFNYLAQKAERDGDPGLSSRFMNACRQARRIYHKQLQKDFRKLETTMDRKEIGAYAQSLWTGTTMYVQHEGEDVARFIGSDKYRAMDAELQDMARDTIYANTKWLALNINEIPLSGSSRAPKPTLN